MRPGHTSIHPPLRRAAWLLFALAVLPATSAAAAPTGALPVAIYPLSADGLSKDEASDVEAVLISGLHQVARGGTLSVREPTVLRPSCGKSPTDECLGGLAGDGVVLVARARHQGLNVLISMALVRNAQKRTHWSSFLTTLSVQDARPCAQALWLLEAELSLPGGTLPAPVVARPTGTNLRASPPATSPPRPAAPVQPIAKKAPPPPARPDGGWSSGRVAGAWVAGGGLALVAAGALAGLQARSLDAKLTDKFDAGTLTPADAASYDTVRRMNKTANVLFLAGGLAVAGGATWYLLSPAVAPVAGGGVTVGVAGRF